MQYPSSKKWSVWTPRLSPTIGIFLDNPSHLVRSLEKFRWVFSSQASNVPLIEILGNMKCSSSKHLLRFYSQTNVHLSKNFFMHPHISLFFILLISYARPSLSLFLSGLLKKLCNMAHVTTWRLRIIFFCKCLNRKLDISYARDHR